MTKGDFIIKMAEMGNITQLEADQQANLFIKALKECLMEDGKVTFRRFGNFEVKNAKARIGRNPKNGKPYPIPEHKAVKFKAGEFFTKEVNDDYKG